MGWGGGVERNRNINMIRSDMDPSLSISDFCFWLAFDEYSRVILKDHKKMGKNYLGVINSILGNKPLLITVFLKMLELYQIALQNFLN